MTQFTDTHRVYPKKYAHGFVVLCFVVVMQSFIMNSHEVFIHIHQGCFAGTGAIVRLPQCRWSKPDGYGKISQCITTTKHSKAKTVCIFLGIYCMHYLVNRAMTVLLEKRFIIINQWIKRIYHRQFIRIYFKPFIACKLYTSLEDTLTTSEIPTWLPDFFIEIKTFSW